MSSASFSEHTTDWDDRLVPDLPSNFLDPVDPVGLIPSVEKLDQFPYVECVKGVHKPKKVDGKEIVGYAKTAIGKIKLNFGASPTCGSVDGLASIRMYSGDIMYHVVNSTLRDPNRKKASLKRLLPFLKLLMQALRSLPKEYQYKGMVYRGEVGVHPTFSKKYQPDQLTVLYGFTSCTISSNVLTTFGGEIGCRTGFLFEIKHGAYKIKAFSEYQKEDEVLLEPCSTFVVKQTINFDDPSEKGELFQLLKAMVQGTKGLRVVKAEQTEPIFDILTQGAPSVSPIAVKPSSPPNIVSSPTAPPSSELQAFLQKGRYENRNLIIPQEMRSHVKNLPVTIEGLIFRGGTLEIQHLHHLTNLKFLEIYSISIAIEHIAKLMNLKSLDLQNTNIGDVGAKHIAKLVNLMTLNARGNKIGDAGAEHIAKLVNLTTLNLPNNSIGAVGAKHIAKLINLTTLNLFANDIKDVGVDHIAKLIKLTTLDLRDNKIGDVGADHIAKLVNLTTLNLEDNNIGDVGVKHIAKLVNMTTLDLRGNNIGDVGAEHIAKLVKLTTLDLRDNKIGDVGAKHIAKLTKLSIKRL